MKRRFPGDQNGPRGHAPVVTGASLRPHDPRFPGRGGNGPPPPQMHRGPPPGRFAGRGGPRAPGGFMPGRGSPGPGMGGRGPPNMGGRGPPHGMHGRGPPMRDPMGRGMPPPPMGGRGNMGRGRMGGRGPMPGRPPPPMGRGNLGGGPPMPPGMPHHIPPPPPRGLPPPPMRGPLHQQPPRPHGGPPPGIPPPPIRPGFPGHHPQAGPATNVNSMLRPAFNSQSLSQPPPTSRVALNPQSRFQANVQQPHSGRPPQVTTAYPSVAVAAAATTNQSNHVAPTSHAQNAASAPIAPYSKEQIESAWKEYDGPNGVKYYHNPIINESTYIKPEALTRKDAATKAATNGRAAKWKQYEDASTGKKYYSNGVTTTWEKPAGFQSDADATAEDSEQPAKKKKKTASKKESEFANKAEATAAFKGLLLAKGIAPNLKWNEVVKLCSADSRWAVCEDALSVGERRQALAEYQTKRANELRDQERQERIRAKEAFGQLLTEVLPTVTSFSAWSSRFPDVRGSLSKDDRFYAVEDEGTRESLFLDFCEEFRKRDERKKRSRKREAQDSFLAFLGEKEEMGSLSFASTWYVCLLMMNEYGDFIRSYISSQGILLYHLWMRTVRRILAWRRQQLCLIQTDNYILPTL
jgi:pre-mRNA-processing factor 40